MPRLSLARVPHGPSNEFIKIASGSPISGRASMGISGVEDVKFALLVLTELLAADSEWIDCGVGFDGDWFGGMGDFKDLLRTFDQAFLRENLCTQQDCLVFVIACLLESMQQNTGVEQNNVNHLKFLLFSVFLKKYLETYTSLLVVRLTKWIQRLNTLLTTYTKKISKS